MLKTRIVEDEIKLNTIIFSEDHSSDRDFYNNKILNQGVNGVINNIIDAEIYEYKPELINNIGFNIFFLRYMQDSELTAITPYMEENFTFYVDNVRKALGLIDLSGNFVKKGFNNSFEIRQNNELRETKSNLYTNKTKIEDLKTKPYIVKDIIGESLLINPRKSGLPIFYNSYTLPFWSKKDNWINENLYYTNKSYFYNSFLLLEIFDSPSNLTQKRLQSTPIYINRRYNITEKNITKDIHYERPSFNLIENVDGYSIFFLDNYLTNELYVKFSFWDALNGNKISLLPSSEQEKDRKWFQHSETFKQELRYLKYVLNFDKKTYKIFEYNKKTNEYDQERINYDLYELAFDNYFLNHIVKNETPINSKNILPVNTVINPLSFSIKNLALEYYTGELELVENELPEINNSDTFLSKTRLFIDIFNNYNTTIAPIYTKKMNVNTFELPVVKHTIKGLLRKLKTFTAKNTDSEAWVIRKMYFNDVILSANGKNYSDVFYNQSETIWSDNTKNKIAESLILMTNTEDTSPLLPYNFTKELFNQIDFFEILLKRIDINQHNLGMGADYVKSNKLIKPYLDYITTTLGLTYYPNHIKTSFYSGFAAKYEYVDGHFNHGLWVTGKDTLIYDKNHSEIYYYIPNLVAKYNLMKSINIEIYNNIKRKSIQILEDLIKEGDKTNLVEHVLVDIFLVFNPLDYPNMVNEDIKILKQSYLTLDDKKIIQDGINLKNISLKLSTPVSVLGYETRDYLIDMFLILNGDNYLAPDEDLKFDLYLNIGNKIDYIFNSVDVITLTGNIIVSIINDLNDIKDITIPLDIKVNLTQANNKLGVIIKSIKK